MTNGIPPKPRPPRPRPAATTTPPTPVPRAVVPPLVPRVDRVDRVDHVTSGPPPFPSPLRAAIPVASETAIIVPFTISGFVKLQPHTANPRRHAENLLRLAAEGFLPNVRTTRITVSAHYEAVDEDGNGETS
jgi:hypothetical protein